MIGKNTASVPVPPESRFTTPIATGQRTPHCNQEALRHNQGQSGGTRRARGGKRRAPRCFRPGRICHRRSMAFPRIPTLQIAHSSEFEISLPKCCRRPALIPHIARTTSDTPLAASQVNRRLQARPGMLHVMQFPARRCARASRSASSVQIAGHLTIRSRAGRESHKCCSCVGDAGRVRIVSHRMPAPPSGQDGMHPVCWRD